MNADQRKTHNSLKNVLIKVVFPASVMCLDSSSHKYTFVHIVFQAPEAFMVRNKAASEARTRQPEHRAECVFSGQQPPSIPLLPRPPITDEWCTPRTFQHRQSVTFNHIMTIKLVFITKPKATTAFPFLFQMSSLQSP